MALVRVPSKEQGKQDDVCHIHNNHNRYVGLSRQPMTGSERLSFTDCRQTNETSNDGPAAKRNVVM